MMQRRGDDDDDDDDDENDNVDEFIHSIHKYSNYKF